MRAWDGRLRFSELTPHKVCDWKCGLQLEKQLARRLNKTPVELFRGQHTSKHPAIDGASAKVD